MTKNKQKQVLQCKLNTNYVGTTSKPQGLGTNLRGIKRRNVQKTNEVITKIFQAGLETAVRSNSEITHISNHSSF